MAENGRAENWSRLLGRWQVPVARSVFTDTGRHPLVSPTLASAVVHASPTGSSPYFLSSPPVSALASCTALSRGFTGVLLLRNSAAFSPSSSPKCPLAASTFSASTRLSAGTSTSAWNAPRNPNRRIARGLLVVATTASRRPGGGGRRSKARSVRSVSEAPPLEDAPPPLDEAPPEDEYALDPPPPSPYPNPPYPTTPPEMPPT